MNSAAQRLLDDLVGANTWYVNAGGAAGTTFSLSLGSKVERARELQNPDVSDEFRRFEGEFQIYCWADWTLDDDEASEALRRLVGQRVERATILEDGALEIRFDSATLRISSSGSEMSDCWELVGPKGEVALPVDGELFVEETA